MNDYVTGTTIKKLREERGMTQLELANQIGVSDKTISKWETLKGLPDITLIESLAKALKISVVELFTGEYRVNQNISSNMLRSKLFVCPICGNVVHSQGDAAISCCGILLPALEGEEETGEHLIHCERIEDEYSVRVDHEMTKEHYISFLAYVTSDRFEMVKLYPEGHSEARFLIRGQGILYAYCNKHGLIRKYTRDI